MDLVAFTLEGYRRFVRSTSVKLHSELIAFVGPNEAGKSSLLAALARLNDDEPFERSEIPRRSNSRPMLRWQLQLSALDRKAISDLYGGAQVERITVLKTADGTRSMTFEPTAPSRAPELRRQTGELLLAEDDFIQMLAMHENFDFELPNDMGEALVEGGDLEPDQVMRLRSFGDELLALANRFNENDVLEAQFTESEFKEFPERLRNLEGQIFVLLEDEARELPADVARRVLFARLPEMRLLRAADRDLRSEYDIESQADAPDRALENLARLAGLDLAELREEVREHRYADVATRRERANARLREVYQESWNQEGVALQLDIQGSLLLVQVTTPRDGGLSSIAERSDGLRWFAALLAFTHGGNAKPILLADEIETHLHYDAQADLIDVLSRQEYTSKVIYTTHSFGCLPNDLGNGVRVVEQVDTGTSRLANGFWTGGAGFSPLLTSMGAAATSFSPARRAVIGEGPTEAIILPTLLRQAAEQGQLDFQVAPGVSGVAAANVPDLHSEAAHVAYLVDGDPGGLNNCQKLIDAGVPRSLIHVLSDLGSGVMETEDLIDPAVYIRCVNEELACWNDLSESIEVVDLAATMRTKAVERWCRQRGVNPPDKVAVAQRVANLSTKERVFAEDRKADLVELLSRLRVTLKLAERAF